MAPIHYSEFSHSADQGPGSPQPQATDFDFELDWLFNQYLRGLVPHHAPVDYPLTIPPTQYTVVQDPTRGGLQQLPAIWPIIGFSNPVSTEISQEHGPLISGRPSQTEILSTQPQVIPSSDTVRPMKGLIKYIIAYRHVSRRKDYTGHST